MWFKRERENLKGDIDFHIFDMIWLTLETPHPFKAYYWHIQCGIGDTEIFVKNFVFALWLNHCVFHRRWGGDCVALCDVLWRVVTWRARRTSRWRTSRRAGTPGWPSAPSSTTSTRTPSTTRSWTPRTADITLTSRSTRQSTFLASIYRSTNPSSSGL